MDNREAISFKTYRRNPMEFLERVNEQLIRNGEDRWPVIRSYLDEHFREISDNWWMALRHDLWNYDEFKAAFKARYWSEATQNIVRDNICHGRYDASRGTTLTAYFLGKVCLARSLEPKIPEESLVTKLAYHYEDGVSRARTGGQIKMVQAMSVLLEEYEWEGYYRRSRQRYETRNVPNNDHHNSNGNNRPNFSNRTNHNNEAYNRPNFNNRGNNDN